MIGHPTSEDDADGQTARPGRQAADDTESANQDNLAKLAVSCRAGRIGRQDGGVSDLVHTSDAAKALGISARSIARWAAEGRIAPDLVTPGGHMRWNIENLRRQLQELRKRDE
jgi:hypothetical protein